jgi:hypothetical protein
VIGQEGVIAAGVFILGLVATALGVLFLHERLPAHYHQDETNAVIRLITNLFVVMTSLVLGLMINSAKNTFEAVDHNVHVIATEMILLDRTLRQYGPEAGETRARLLAYAQRTLLPDDSPRTDPLVVGDKTAETLLYDVGNSLGTVKPTDADHLALWQDARDHFRRIASVRWDLVEQSEGAIPGPLIAMLVLWLMLIFGSFGYRAPRNAVVSGSVVLAAALVAGAFYLILDMDTPFSGVIQVSRTPMQRVIAEMR